MSDPNPRYLVVGLGSIGQRHLRNLRALRPASKIAALRHGPATGGGDHPECDFQFYSLDEVRAFKPHAAIIAGPASTHVDMAAALVDMGVPLLVEKPFAASMDGLLPLIEAARQRQLTLMVGYNLRFKQSLVEVRRQILSGEVGEILSVRAEVGQYLPDWRPGSDYRAAVSARAALGGGALLELSHEIDYLYWLFGMPDRVSCRGGRYSALEIDVEDLVELCLEYEAPRRLVSVHLDFLQRVPSRTCKFIGTEGTLVWDGIADKVETLAVDSGKSRAALLANVDRNEIYVEEIRHFLDCAETGATPLIDATQAYEVMSIVAAAKLSLHNGTVERPLKYAAR
ncbi:MAG: putative dehydrogenase [Massilia sp.]|nr:putative dehydrogenase [Massilia sp.]